MVPPYRATSWQQFKKRISALYALLPIRTSDEKTGRRYDVMLAELGWPTSGGRLEDGIAPGELGQGDYRGIQPRLRPVDWDSWSFSQNDRTGYASRRRDPWIY